MRENLGVLTLAGGSKVLATLDAELPERLSRVKEVEESSHSRRTCPYQSVPPFKFNACDKKNALRQFGQFYSSRVKVHAIGA